MEAKHNNQQDHTRPYSTKKVSQTRTKSLTWSQGDQARQSPNKTLKTKKVSSNSADPIQITTTI